MARLEGSGTRLGFTEPKVMLSKPTSLAVPPKSIDFAIPAKPNEPISQLQKVPVGSPTHPLAVWLDNKAIEPNKLPVKLRPEYMFTETAVEDV